MLDDGLGDPTYTGGMGASNITAQSTTDGIPGRGCETLQSGTGNVNGFNATSSDGTAACSLSGTYTREDSVLFTLTLTGTCSVNPNQSVTVTFISRGTFSPTTSNPVTGARISCGFTIS